MLTKRRRNQARAKQLQRAGKKARSKPGAAKASPGKPKA
jgi:hypothetical protein